MYPRREFAFFVVISDWHCKSNKMIGHDTI
nr:MAG TPA: metallophosphatase domain protein [Caudoviricetes sp.]